MHLLALVEKLFASVAAQYMARKKLAESLVCSWHWATGPVWDLNPIYFEMNSERPGRELKEKPSGKDEFFSYGTDASGRIVVEREHSATRAGNKEKFYDWSKNPVEVVYFNDDRKKRAINVKLAKYDDDRLVQIATAAGGGSTLEIYSWGGSHVMEIEILHGPRTQKGLEKLTGYQVVRAAYTTSGVVQRVEIDWLPRPPHGKVALPPGASQMVQKVQTQVVYKRRNKPVQVDLRKDAIKFREMLARAVTMYASKHADARAGKKHPPVTRIALIYLLGDGQSTPSVHMCLDSRPNSEPDGEYSHYDFARVTRSGWLGAVQLMCNGDNVPVSLLDGTTRECVDDEFEKLVGEFLVSVLVSVRDEGVFAELPRGKRCELEVEEGMNGTFGWPHYEDRGKENLL